MRQAFIDTLERLCEADKDIFLLTGDLGFKLFDRFRQGHPDRFLNTGIAEPNMIGIAAGLALSGKRPYCYSMIPFLITRCLEHIKIDICYNNLDVRLIGVGSGFTYGLEGITHFATEDIAVMRSLPNMTLVAPGDPYEASACINETADYKGPIYIRLSKTGEPKVHQEMPGFKIGKGIKVLDKGNDICILSTGNTLNTARLTSEILLKNGFGVKLISMHTIKPLDEKLLRDCARRSRSVFTIEPHSIIGGLGSAVAEILSEMGYDGVFKRIGLADKYNSFIGRDEYLLNQHGVHPQRLAKNIMRLIEKA